MHYHDKGCPTLRGFRSVGTTDLDPMFVFLQVLHQLRRCFHFVVVGYVVMPEHIYPQSRGAQTGAGTGATAVEQFSPLLRRMSAARCR